ncbi:MAG: c-type cytochrome [Trueperaceae bacterium]
MRKASSTNCTLTPRQWSGIGITLLLLALFVGLLEVSAQTTDTVQSDETPAGDESVAALGAPNEAGAKVYANSCSVCHGVTGLGLAEAKEAFPADHRHCQRCHKSGNPPSMTLATIEMRQHDLFDIGEPPAIRGEGTLASHATPEALRAYLEATMPRYRPGSLSDDEYAAVTVYLLHLNDR